LQHFIYCPRQYALIHLEQVFEENVFTLRGHADHRRVDQGHTTTAPDGTRTLRSLPLFQDELGLVGIADAVELAADGTPFPIEYKHGRLQRNPHKNAADETQLAAQAICLEFMFQRPVPQGAVFHVSSNKRRLVPIGPALRQHVLDALEGIRKLNEASQLPPPANDSRCRNCSLLPLCQPEMLANLNGGPFSTFGLFAP
jgi:CRISPR-associated exonuclease Cas4